MLCNVMHIDTDRQLNSSIEKKDERRRNISVFLMSLGAERVAMELLSFV